MSISAVVKNFRDGSLVVSDATTPTPITLTVQYEAGDFSLNRQQRGQQRDNCLLGQGGAGHAQENESVVPVG